MGKTHLHRACYRRFFGRCGTIVDDWIARESNPKTSQLEGGIYVFGGCSTGLGLVSLRGFASKLSENEWTLETCMFLSQLFEISPNPASTLDLWRL